MPTSDQRAAMGEALFVSGRNDKTAGRDVGSRVAACKERDAEAGVSGTLFLLHGVTQNDIC